MLSSRLVALGRVSLSRQQLAGRRLVSTERVAGSRVARPHSSMAAESDDPDFRELATYQFSVSQEHLDTVKATLPAVAEAGTDFTKHFYRRMFSANPGLMNVFNQTNQAVGNQPKKLLKTVAVAAQAAIESGHLPGEAIEGICQKHVALDVGEEAYAVVGEHIIGTITELLTDDQSVLDAWGALYGNIVGVFVARENEIREQMANTPGGWLGRREFSLADKQIMSDKVVRFTFEPVDGGTVPLFKAGKFTTVWAQVDAEGLYGKYTEQPRHYTLALPYDREDATRTMSISVKKDGLVSTLLHDSHVGSSFDLSAPFGCFNLGGAEQLWLARKDAPVVFLSGGIGITPVLAMLENIYVDRPATWLHATQNGKEHAYRDRLRQISAVRSGELQRRVWYDDPLPEDGEPGNYETDPEMYNLAKYHYRGRMDLPGAAPDFPPNMLHLDNEAAQYYMCGPPGFMKAQGEALQSLGVDESRIHWEGF